MVRVITQQTFNEVVRENMEEFNMTMTEAIQEAIQQFEAQGVDLSNIVKSIDVDQVSTPLTQCLKKLQETEDVNQVISYLKFLQKECISDNAKKIRAGKEGAYDVLIQLFSKFSNNREIQILIYQVLLALMTGYPDLLDDKGISHMVNIVTKSRDMEIIKYTLRWCRECCIKHEKNRQAIFESYIINNFKRLLETDAVKEVCGLIRSLCLDDDVRVVASKAHEHARSLAAELFCPISELLDRLNDNKENVYEILLTASTLMVRNEFCSKAYELGVLTSITKILSLYVNEEKIVRVCLMLLKSLAGNDEVKLRITQDTSLIVLVMHSIGKHESKASCSAAGLGLIAALSLRSPSNSKILCNLNAPEIIINAMKAHPKDVNVQKRGCWAIRNIVSRSKELCKEFLKIGVEEVLLSAVKFHQSCNDDVKAALRDLGCSVSLIEQWTGTGVALQN